MKGDTTAGLAGDDAGLRTAWFGDTGNFSGPIPGYGGVVIALEDRTRRAGEYLQISLTNVPLNGNAYFVKTIRIY